MSQTMTEHGWQLREDSASAYERYLVPLLFDASAEHLLASLEVQAGERVLDLACGTGAVTRNAARRVGPRGEVIAVDVNEQMLAVARRSTQAPTVRWELASAASLPLPDACVDVACCQQGLQFFGDRAGAMAQLHRVLVPGGRLGVSVCRALDHQPGYVPLVDALRRHVGDAAAEGMASPFAFGDRDQLRTLVSEAGFRDVDVRIVVWPLRLDSAEAFLRGETASSPLGEVVAALDADVVAALIADLSDGLDPHRDDAGLSFPLETLVVTARR